MDWLEAFILGVLQGLTEFLPVSSSGHLELGKEILGVKAADNALFSIAVHAATSLSTIIVFRFQILELLRGLLAFKWNAETRFVALLALSALPVLVVGLAFKDQVDALFAGNLLLVGASLLGTGALLLFTHFAPKKINRPTAGSALVMGAAQAVAVLPGVSRSGATICAAILAGVDKEQAARFSFLMALIPILGAAALETKDVVAGDAAEAEAIGMAALAVGFVTALVVGIFACRLMLRIVRGAGLLVFAIYCGVVGGIALGWTLAAG